MSFRISLSSNKQLPQAVRKARVSQAKPLSFHRVSLGKKRGVIALVRQSASRQAYFYPQDVIEANILERGGRDGYVYKEGFDNDRVLATISPLIKSEAPTWHPFSGESRQFPLNKLLISQPGIDMWRMLCFALDHTSTPDLLDAQPSLAVNSLSLSQSNPVLIAGNHRSLFAFVMGQTTVPLLRVNAPVRAFNFNTGLVESVANVERTLGSRRIEALAASFIQQVAQQET